jgi:PHD/YefM family antitoxin component YafN of YafNO toxin-antitoxin module
MPTITANDIKRRGISSIASVLEDAEDATISVRGKSKYVVMSIQHYQHLRACELEAALLEAKEDRQAGRIIDRTIAEHIADLKNDG